MGVLVREVIEAAPDPDRLVHARAFWEDTSMGNRFGLGVVAGVAIVLVVIALLAIIGYRQWSTVLRFPVEPELVQNGSFENGDFTDQRKEEQQPVVAPIDVGPGGGGIIHVARAAKLLRSGSGSLKDWEIFGNGNGLHPDCQPRPTKGLDAIAWVDSDKTFAIPPANDGRDAHRHIDLTGYCTKRPTDFGGVSQRIDVQCFQEYEVRFRIGTAWLFNNPPLVTVQLEIPGIFTESFSSAVPSENSQWNEFTRRFHTGPCSAAPPSITLKFSALAGGDYVGLDSVSLRQVCLLGICSQ